MCIRAVKDGVVIEIRVKANSRRFGFREGFILEVTGPAREGKANQEIQKGLRRLLGRDVEIVKGMRSRDKAILVKGASIEEATEKLRSR